MKIKYFLYVFILLSTLLTPQNLHANQANIDTSNDDWLEVYRNSLWIKFETTQGKEILAIKYLTETPISINKENTLVVKSDRSLSQFHPLKDYISSQEDGTYCLEAEYDGNLEFFKYNTIKEISLNYEGVGNYKNFIIQPFISDKIKKYVDSFSISSNIAANSFLPNGSKSIYYRDKKLGNKKKFHFVIEFYKKIKGTDQWTLEKSEKRYITLIELENILNEWKYQVGNAYYDCKVFPQPE